ncbi:MAG: ATPase, T2SS/T4P/T4SS family [Halolamina sp.]
MTLIDAARNRLGSAATDGTDPDGAAEACNCQVAVGSPVGTDPSAEPELRVDAIDCDGGGDLAAAAGCRARVVRALTGQTVARMRVRHRGQTRVYDGDGFALLVAAARFAARVERSEPDVAARARTDPLGAARRADARAGPVARAAAETGFAEAVRFDDYADAFSPAVGLVVADALFEPSAPSAVSTLDERELSTGAEVTRYETPAGPPRYHLRPPERDLDDAECAVLAAAASRLGGTGTLVGEGSEPTVDDPSEAVSAVGAARDDAVAQAASSSTATLAAALARHVDGVAAIRDCFVDPRVSDAYLSAPVADNPLRVVVDGDFHVTNVRFTPRGTAALASRLRRTSGRSFSRASPRVDATLSLGGTTAGAPLHSDRPSASPEVRVAGVTRPLSDGTAFAFRRQDGARWTLSRLVANGTVPPSVAGLLSVAVADGAAVLVTGARGSGKTTFLGSLLWELPASVRTLVVEDTPELPVAALARQDRDVQRLTVQTSVGDDEGGAETSAATALRTALRLGGGALVVGEVRGTEAATLYEAMRVGAADEAVLGTIHGEDAASVRERVVTDLGVPASSFAATDLVVSLADGPEGRQVNAVAEVRPTDDGVAFAPLYDAETDDGLGARVPRGDSVAVAELAEDGSYADVLDRVDARTDALGTMAECDVHRPSDLPPRWGSS